MPATHTALVHTTSAGNRRVVAVVEAAAPSSALTQIGGLVVALHREAYHGVDIDECDAVAVRFANDTETDEMTFDAYAAQSGRNGWCHPTIDVLLAPSFTSSRHDDRYVVLTPDADEPYEKVEALLRDRLHSYSWFRSALDAMAPSWDRYKNQMNLVRSVIGADVDDEAIHAWLDTL